MARSIDLSQLPPPQAICCTCGRTVMLDRRARAAGKFRCPHCWTDNLVGADGAGRPLRGDPERVAEMALVRCHGCATPNRLPRRILQAGRYTCCHCRQVQPVPHTLRRRAGIVSLSLSLGVAAATLGVFGWSAWRVLDAIHRFGAPWAVISPAARYDPERSVAVVGTPQASTAQGQPGFSFTVMVSNTMGVPATYHVRAKVLSGEELLAESTVSVPLGVGERRQVDIFVANSSVNRQLSGGVEVVGVS